jgi:transposase InsO family protein
LEEPFQSRAIQPAAPLQRACSLPPQASSLEVVPWPPLALPQCWPFCFWIAVVLDNYSRRVLGTAVFYGQPTSEKVRAFLGRTISNVGNAPKHLICDRGVQFDNEAFRRYCRKKGIKIRYGAVGKHGSIAIVERFILTMKQCLALLPIIPLCKRSFQQELSFIADWYNASRPHTTLKGATPDEKYFGRFPACRKPRHEPRARWPRASPCAAPWALMRRAPGAKLELEVQFHGGRKPLPIVKIRPAA